MIKAVTKDPIIWKSIVSLLNALDAESFINFKPSGIYFRSMDESKVSMINFEWLADKFDSYECTDEITLGVPVGEFNKILGRANKDDTITISYKDENQLRIKIGNLKDFTMRLIPTDDNKLPLPQMTPDLTFSIPLKDFQGLTEDVKIYNDFISLSTKKGKVIVSGNGDLGNVKTAIDDTSIEKEEKYESQFSIWYMNHALSSLQNLVKDIQINFKEAKPIRLDFHLEDGGVMEYFVAPKMI